jgi:hypothetical protein
MKDYKKIFLGEDVNDGMSNVETGTGEPPSDSDQWAQSNQNIVNNPDVSKQFEVEGLPADITGEYVKKIENWRGNLTAVSQKLEEIYKFATDNADKPGAGEIFDSIGGLVEKIMTDFGTLEGQLRSLGAKIKVSINRENEKAKK